jgi:hypothetical protein
MRLVVAMLAASAEEVHGMVLVAGKNSTIMLSIALNSNHLKGQLLLSVRHPSSNLAGAQGVPASKQQRIHFIIKCTFD